MRRNELFLGWAHDASIGVSARDRATHMMVVGSPDSGKSTFLEGLIRQDIRHGRGCCLIDPQGSLSEKVLQYYLYLQKHSATPVAPLVLYEPADGDWVLPFNPFERGPGDVSTQVDRRISATLKAWGLRFGDDTPRLEKWLRCLYTALIEKGLTILEASYLLEFDPKLRAYVTDALENSVVKTKFDQLAGYRPQEFFYQIESTENRLMRFTPQDAIGRSMGVGLNALDFGALMDRGGILIVNLRTGDSLSEMQQRLLGTFLVNEFYEAAMRRDSGARPFYLYIDEAGNFVSPELGKALDHCRQKGLHITFAFQHLAQFRREDPLVYKSVKNSALTKVVFRVPDREDALELAGDVFSDLALPVPKHVHRRETYRLEDEWVSVRNTGRTHSQSRGGVSAIGRATASGQSHAESHGMAFGHTAVHSESSGSIHFGEHHEGSSEAHLAGDTSAFGESHASVSGAFHSHSLSFSRSDGWNETTGEQETETRQFITSHIPTTDETPEFYTLEERRWMAAEELMSLPTGHAVLKVRTNRAVALRTPRPKPVLMDSRTFVELKARLQAVHACPRDEADRRIATRRERLAREASLFSRGDNFEPTPKKRR